MTDRPFAFVLIAALLFAVGSLAASCGGNNGAPSEPLSIEQYFARLDQLSAQLESSLEDAEAATVAEDALQGIQENLANTAALLTNFADGVDDLEPPGEIKDQHEEFAGAVRALANAVDDYSDKISGVDSIEELQTVVDSEELDAAGTRSELACLTIEQAASDNGIETKLNC